MTTPTGNYQQRVHTAAWLYFAAFVSFALAIAWLPAVFGPSGLGPRVLIVALLLAGVALIRFGGRTLDRR